MPSITVLMPVYNCREFLGEAIASVLGQTSTDWTLLAVDDGSKDGSGEMLDQLNDPRIRVVHQANKGLAGALNTGIAHCETEFIARLDSDDVALPTRLEKQLAFLRANPRVGLVGTQVAPMFAGRAGRGLSLPLTHSVMDATLMQGRHAVCHSSIMVRADKIRQIGGYWERGVAEDWDMYLRMAEQAELANINEVLMHIRIGDGGIQSRQMLEVRLRTAFSCENARLRRSGRPTITYEEYLEQRRAESWWKRSIESLDTYAMVQYRKSQPEILGRRVVRGYARLALAAACSPQLTARRIGRVVRHRLQPRSQTAASHVA